MLNQKINGVIIDQILLDILDFIISNPITTKTEISKRFNPNKERAKLISLNIDLWLLKEAKLVKTLSVLNPDYNQLFFLSKNES